VRLGTAIALELLIAGGAIGAVTFGVTRAADLADSYLVRPAVAAKLPLPETELLPKAMLHVEHPPSTPSVFGGPDLELLAPLGATPVVKTKINHGGTSLSLRLDFASGARAAFKPLQIYPQSDPRKEIAAYRIDRLLGIGRVPPATWAEVTVASVVAGAEEQYRPFVAKRLADEALYKQGMLRGEMSWWVPEVVPARLNGLPLDEPEGRHLWSQYLSVNAKVPLEARNLITQLGAMIVFDALVDNDDRWSGGNILMSPDRQVLYTMDNTFTFSREWSDRPAYALKKCQVFSRALVARIRGLTLAQLEAAVRVTEPRAGSPSMLLTDEELAAVLMRRDRIVEHIDRMIAEYGESAVLSL
jgi:hypothetical protein